MKQAVMCSSFLMDSTTHAATVMQMRYGHHVWNPQVHVGQNMFAIAFLHLVQSDEIRETNFTAACLLQDRWMVVGGHFCDVRH